MDEFPGVIFKIFAWLFIIGYILCIYKFCQCDFIEPFKGEVIYGIGIFTGLGGILGWFDWGQ